MSFDPHQQSQLESFEEQLRGLSPRPPVQPWLLHQPNACATASERASEEKLWVRPASYRTIGISATCGALLGGLVSAACTLILLQQPAADGLSQPLPSTQLISKSAPPTLPAKPPEAFETAGAASVIEVQPAIPAEGTLTPLNWWNDPYAVLPNTLAVGTHFVSHRSVSTAVTTDHRLSEWEAPLEQSRAIPEQPSATDRLIPQRQWMQQLLDSPPQIF